MTDEARDHRVSMIDYPTHTEYGFTFKSTKYNGRQIWNMVEEVLQRISDEEKELNREE